MDSAVRLWGEFVEARLAERDGNGERAWLPEELLGEWETIERHRYAPASELVERFQRTGGRR